MKTETTENTANAKGVSVSRAVTGITNNVERLVKAGVMTEQDQEVIKILLREVMLKEIGL